MEQILRLQSGSQIEFEYTNYKNDTSYRKVIVKEIFFGSTPHHKIKQWFLRAFDLDKKEERCFALADINA
jgi:hypothetical protein